MLVQGTPILSASIDAYLPEGDFAEALDTIQKRHTNVEIGSYPFHRDGRYGAALVVRGTDKALLSTVIDEIAAAIVALGGESKLG